MKVSVFQQRLSYSFSRRNRRERKVLFLSRLSSLFSLRASLVTMFQVLLRQAGNLAAARYLLSVFEPKVSKPLRSAKFLNSPHDLKFIGKRFLSFRNVDWRDQKWHRMNGSRPEARILKFGNRVAMTFCAIHYCHRICPSCQR